MVIVHNKYFLVLDIYFICWEYDQEIAIVGKNKARNSITVMYKAIIAVELINASPIIKIKRDNELMRETNLSIPFNSVSVNI